MTPTMCVGEFHMNCKLTRSWALGFKPALRTASPCHTCYWNRLLFAFALIAIALFDSPALANKPRVRRDGKAGLRHVANGMEGTTALVSSAGVAATLTFFTAGQEAAFDQLLLDTGHMPLGVEDFEENRLPVKSVSFLDDPLDSATMAAGFIPGDIVDFVRFQSNNNGPGTSGGNPTGLKGMFVLTEQFLGAANVTVCSNTNSGSLDIDLLAGTGNHTALGMTLVQIVSDETVMEVRVFDTNDVFIGMIPVTLDPNVPLGATFLGIVSPGVRIGRVNLWSGDGGEGLYDVTVYTSRLAGDFDDDFDVDLSDVAEFQTCLMGSDVAHPASCELFDFDADSDVDARDLAIMQMSFTGSP